MHEFSLMRDVVAAQKRPARAADHYAHPAVPRRVEGTAQGLLGVFDGF